MADSPAATTASTTPGRYAPRIAGGALPPGVSAEAVGRLYKQSRADLTAKKVLAILGIRAALTGRAEQLRAALDNPAARAAVTTPRGDLLLPSFHEAMYGWLLGTPAGSHVHDLVIEPAQRVVEERTFLDPERFAEAVARHAAALTPPGPVIEPGTDAEALALFALAFGLLQVDDGAALLAPVVALAPAFATYFGD